MSLGARRGVALAEEARHARAVGQGDGAEAERRGDLAQEAADLGRGQAPDFELDGAAALGDAHHAGPVRRPAGQGVEAIDRRGPAGALQPAAQLGELAVERQAAHVRADHGDRHAILGDDGIGCRPAAAGSWSCRAAAAPRAASARRRPAGRGRRCGGAIRVMPNGRPSGRKPAGRASARQPEEIHEVGVVAEMDVVEHRLALEIGHAIDRAAPSAARGSRGPPSPPRRCALSSASSYWPSKASTALYSRPAAG